VTAGRRYVAARVSAWFVHSLQVGRATLTSDVGTTRRPVVTDISLRQRVDSCGFVTFDSVKSKQNKEPNRSMAVISMFYGIIVSLYFLDRGKLKLARIRADLCAFVAQNCREWMIDVPADWSYKYRCRRKESDRWL